MEFKVYLIHEDYEVITKPENILVFNVGVPNFEFKLLKYLDEFGYTIFNPLQMNDLKLDLELLNHIRYDGMNNYTQILEMIKECDLHVYLVFEGNVP